MTRITTPANEETLLNIAVHGTASHVERTVRQFRRVERIEATMAARDRARDEAARVRGRCLARVELGVEFRSGFGFEFGDRVVVHIDQRLLSGESGAVDRGEPGAGATAARKRFRGIVTRQCAFVPCGRDAGPRWLIGSLLIDTVRINRVLTDDC